MTEKNVRVRLDDSVFNYYSSVREAKRYLSSCKDVGTGLTLQEEGGWVELWNGDEWVRVKKQASR